MYTFLNNTNLNKGAHKMEIIVTVLNITELSIHDQNKITNLNNPIDFNGTIWISKVWKDEHDIKSVMGMNSETLHTLSRNDFHLELGN